MLILLLGLAVLASCASSLPFLVLCIGWWIRWIWVILGSPIWRFLSFFEQWAGHWSLSEKVTRPHVRANRLFLIPSVPVSEGIEIGHGCQFVCSLVRSLAKLPGGVGRFRPCDVGSHMSRSRHLGWNQCSHGLFARHWNLVTNKDFRYYVGVFKAILRGQQRSFLTDL